MWTLVVDDEVLAHMMAPERKRASLRVTRDAMMFTAGLVGVLHETLVYNGERPTLLILFAAMMGLPLYLRQNGKS